MSRLETIATRNRTINGSEPEKNRLEETLSRASAKKLERKKMNEIALRHVIERQSGILPGGGRTQESTRTVRILQTIVLTSENLTFPRPTQQYRFGTQDEQRGSDGGVGLAYPAPCVAIASVCASTQQNPNRPLSREGASTEKRWNRKAVTVTLLTSYSPHPQEAVSQRGAMMNRILGYHPGTLQPALVLLVGNIGTALGTIALP